jgi:hypothetical protein
MKSLHNKLEYVEFSEDKGYDRRKRVLFNEIWVGDTCIFQAKNDLKFYWSVYVDKTVWVAPSNLRREFAQRM